FLSTGPVDRVQRPVKLIVANERALAAGTRYVDADLNRLFPGVPDSDVHEEQLAHALHNKIEDCMTLGIHATVSFAEPFGTLADPTPLKTDLMRALPVDYAADFSGVVEGRSVNLGQFINVEAGYQGSASAVENAYGCLLAYLRATDVLPGATDPTPTVHYRVDEPIRKAPDQSYEVCAENFDRVPSGEAYAVSAAGGQLTADEPFWPVLLSADGHETLLGYRARRVGTLGDTAGQS
ncbi:MAG: succinylglutamate desuccinylase, partial [halophilic archaeon J07HX5]